MKMQLKARMTPRKKIVFPYENVWGVNLKIALRNEAKNLELYRKPVELNPLVSGSTDDGEPIPINNLGKYIFGTPGYKSNIVVWSFEENISISIPDIDEVEQLLSQAVEKLQKSRVASL